MVSFERILLKFDTFIKCYMQHWAKLTNEIMYEI